MGPTENRVNVDGHEITLSNLDKVMYPATGTTKGEVIDYYRRVGGVLIPQAAWRPATRKRWVNGVGTSAEPGQVFFRKDLEDSAPEWVPRASIEHKSGTTTYPLVNDDAVLVWLAQLAALEVHTPQWRHEPSTLAPHNPDRLVLDLDPGDGATLADCAQVARWCRDILTDMNLDAYPVTSGSKGIHLYAPLDGSTTTAQASDVAHRLARALETEHPDRVVSDMKKALRTGKVLVDWSQNNGAKTTVCPYSLRGRLRPTVAAPRSWDELDDPDLQQLDLHEVLRRVESGDDPLAALAYREPDGQDRLATYRSMRDPAKTPEPVPAKPAPAQGNSRPTFVIQEHHATRLHWDFRLEHHGVLVSWAVPKGPPLITGDNRLAVHTEDHPLDYGTFEGTIPKGQYGGGTVGIWDAGTIETEKWNEGREVIVVCHGRPDGGLGGEPRRYAFIHTGHMGRGKKRGDDDQNWLLHLMADQADAEADAPSDPATAPKPRAASPLTPSEPDVVDAPPAPADDVAPMLATPGTVSDVGGNDWAYEMKWDGIRVIASVTPGAVRLTSRGGHDITAMFPELAELLQMVDTDGQSGGCVIDGEIVALDPDGRPSFHLLQRRLGLQKPADIDAARMDVPVHLMAFDLLRRGGQPLLRRTYRERRDALYATLAEGTSVHVPHADHGDIGHAIELSRRLGLEGVVAKRESSTYLPGKRGRGWIKIKHERHQEVVVIGWRPGNGARAGGVGSLLIAVPDDEGSLHYAGRVGSGFSDADLREAAAVLTRIQRDDAAVGDVSPADRRGAHWVEPDLVGEVRFTERTPDGKLRHPVWRGWRPEKDAEEVRWE